MAAETMFRIPLTGGDTDPKFVQSTMKKGPLDTTADVRDILAHAIGGRYKGITDIDIKANFTALANKVGLPTAQKLLTRAFLYNQNNTKGNPEDRIAAFYNSRDDDPEIDKILQQVKGFGYGAKEGALSSHSRGVTDLTPAAQKILLRIAQK
jgi:hypothetical protein